MERLIRHLHGTLTKTDTTVAVAESCTGGMLAALLTRTPGSSRYFLLGLVAYSNAAKQSLLGVSARLLSSHGAVSKALACRMSERVRSRAGADYGIGVTGIAGPSGGSIRKPVGTVFIAVTNNRTTVCKKYCFRGKREAIRRNAAMAALRLLKENL